MNGQMKLELKAVGDITGHFLVPAFQRGYRWGEEQVKLLLRDISENGTKQYCLQPIVVKRQPEDNFELIDGQQRLTTLYLIFLYIKREVLPYSNPPFSIKYETRPHSAAYLDNLDEAIKNDNIDFFHLHASYQCIKKWFDDQDDHRRQNEALKFYGYLHDWVKVIWYETSHEVDSATLFTRLNVGRIPLTNAELVKALMLAKRVDSSMKPELRQQHESYLEIEIATQWDMIERDLHDDNFWAFLSNQAGRTYPTRIEFIFNMFPDSGRTKERFETFFYFKEQLETKCAKDVWANILARYHLLKEWFEDRDLYHKIGYLVATHTNLVDLVKASEGITKSRFDELLDARIKASLKLSTESIEELSYERPDPCNRLLLLFNVESVRALRNSSERYPFHAHKEQSWSLEHIHAQHAEMLSKKEQWQEWLRQHLAALGTFRIDDPEKIRKKDSLIADVAASIEDINKESFTQLSMRITEVFGPSGPTESVDSIANLALLSGGANSTLSNSVFQVKRLKILELDRAGEYIPICTRRVFFKYYTDTEDQQMHLWSQQDRKCYLNAMFSSEYGVLRRYLDD